ncbi:uncharacterized protein Z519_06378 [Cladophialophora bantiana CBS 173.52]|uniref:Uncharacterized protein n=1 Tax=Cladophialophora bantiana (strain ATCC 10958 / CBS 173.52 / CDC B-1940 / NIH 8579) TaxID=1442370 RepID=A0A0D2ERP0_CLAB1|nr:uncharacterized protein Z519_06378 [Cladophialophora bantiana CBS 173.52]KIW92531.1 hypothetical protein Z519_06378 [Cladophialophora bantiana CBS 173.52]
MARSLPGLDLPRKCGPIMEEVDEYVQFVHFTAKEYLFSPKIHGCIELAEATLSLAKCCVSYFCQRHHQSGLTDQDLEVNILSGLYRLQNFAAAMWLELVECYIDLNKQSQLPNALIDVLESSQAFTADDEEGEQPSLKVLKSRSPVLYEMERTPILPALQEK